MADPFGKEVDRIGSDRRKPDTREQIINNIVGTFNEMAGMSLTVPQACRLFGAEQRHCARDSTPAWHEAQPNFGKTDGPDRIRGYAVVRVQSEFQSAAQRCPVNERERGHRKPGQPAQRYIAA